MNAQPKDIAKKEPTPVILQYLDRFKDQIAAALPRHMTPDRMARIVTTEVRKVPKLLTCNPKSLFGAVIQASQLGLEPGNALGHAYLIPYGKDVNLIIGYRGMIDLARRSGQIISIEARPVFDGDEFSYEFGLNPDLKHKPGPTNNRGDLTHVYAVAKLKGGGTQWDVMTMGEVELIRNQSKAGNNGPWKTHFEEMAKKTVIRRLFKYLPVSIELQKAVGLDEQAEAGVDQKNSAIIEGDFMPLDDEAEEPEAANKIEAVKNKIKKTSKAKTKPAVEEKEETAEEVDEADETGEVDYPYVREMIQNATTIEDLDEAESMVSLLDEDFHVELIEIALDVRKKLKAA